MATHSVSINVAWWLRWYIAGVALCAMLTGLEPDMERVKATAMKGVRLS